jgi:hypothetical protein
MTKEQITAVLDRVRSWPAQRQEDAAALLQAMESQETEVYILSAEERADLRDAIAEMTDGDLASSAEVAEVFSRYRS